MGVDIRREFTPHVNPNDCWALVLSRISGKDYNDICKDMREKGYISDAGFNNRFLFGVLREYGYSPVLIHVPRQTTRIRHVLSILYDYEVVIGSMNDEKKLPHLSYAHHGVDYTTSESDSSMDDIVLQVFVKNALITSTIIE